MSGESVEARLRALEGALGDLDEQGRIKSLLAGELICFRPNGKEYARVFTFESAATLRMLDEGGNRRIAVGLDDPEPGFHAYNKKGERIWRVFSKTRTVPLQAWKDSRRWWFVAFGLVVLFVAAVAFAIGKGWW